MVDSHLLKRAVATVSIVLGLSAVGLSQVRMQNIIDRVDREADLRVASQCVASWERLEQIRDANEATYRANAETLLSFASVNPDAEQQERIKRYRELVEADVLEIRNRIEDPTCDLKAAQQQLAEDS